MPTRPSPAWLSPAPSSSAPGPPTGSPATPCPSTLRVRGLRGAGGERGGCQLRTLPLSRSPRGREREPGHPGAAHLQIAPVAGSVRHQLGRQPGGGCIQGVVGSLGWSRGGHPARAIAVPRCVPRCSTGTLWRGSTRRSAPRRAPASCGARSAPCGTLRAATAPWPAPTARRATVRGERGAGGPQPGIPAPRPSDPALCPQRTTSATARSASAPLSPR